MGRIAIGLPILVLLAIAPADGTAGQSVLQTEKECQETKPKTDTWAFQYCQVRNRYLDLVIMGHASETDTIAAVKIEEDRTQCIQRIGAKALLDLNSPEIKEMITGLRQGALPMLIDRMGKEAGTREFKRRVKVSLAAIELGGRIELTEQGFMPLKERCDEDAVRVYLARIPSLSE